MKRTYFSQTSMLPTRAIPAGIALALAVSFMPQDAGAAVMAVDLRSASDFAVLAGAGITVAGAVESTRITGDIGTFPTTTITGLGNVVLDGENHAGDAVTQQGKFDLSLAFADAASRMPTTVYGPIHDLGGETLLPGVYNGPSSFGITGNLILDAAGDPDAVWIFQTGSTLITADGSNVLLTGGAQAGNVFWQVGSSATLGTSSSLQGTILAQNSITLTTGAELTGRALALDGAVTLDTNLVQIPEPGSALLIGTGLIPLLMRRRRLSKVK